MVLNAITEKQAHMAESFLAEMLSKVVTQMDIYMFPLAGVV